MGSLFKFYLVQYFDFSFSGTIPDDPPITVDHKITLMEPFSFQDWMEKNSEEIDSEGSKKVFEGDWQFSVRTCY